MLLSEGLPLGVVTSIAGSTRALVTVAGLAGHAGTVPMNLRRDAATAAAEIVLAVEKRCSREPGLVGTIGQLQVPEGAVNVIPGRCELSLDVRAPDDSTRFAAYDDIVAECARIAARRNVTVSVRKVLDVSCAPCSAARKADRREHLPRDGYGGSAPPAERRRARGQMASLTEIGMLFVRCGNGGISHDPTNLWTKMMRTSLAAC